MHADIDSNGRISLMEMDPRTAHAVCAALTKRLAVYALAYTQAQEALKDSSVDLRRYDSLLEELGRLEEERKLVAPVEYELCQALSVTGAPAIPECSIYPPTAHE